MSKLYTDDDVRAKLGEWVTHHGDVTWMANKIGVPRPSLSAVLNGHARPSKKMAAYVGMEPANCWRLNVAKK